MDQVNGKCADQKVVRGSIERRGTGRSRERRATSVAERNKRDGGRRETKELWRAGTDEEGRICYKYKKRLLEIKKRNARKSRSLSRQAKIDKPLRLRSTEHDLGRLVFMLKTT